MRMKSEYLKVDDETKLCLPHPKQAEALFKLIDNQRDYLGRWLIWVDWTKGEENTRKFLKDSYQLNKGGQQLTTIIQHKGEYCGSVGFVKLDKLNHVGEIGYWLSEIHQGRGIMTKSCQRLIRYGFEELGLNRIVIRTAKGNLSSAEIPLRLGFTEEGTQRQAGCIRGVFHDLRVFSLLREEFTGGG